MKTPPDSDLMAYADGELDEAELREIEARLTHEPALRAKVDGVTEVGELLRGHLELSADAVPERRLDAMWREIDKAIDRDGAPASAAVTATAAPSSEGGVWKRLGRWFDRYRGHVLTGAVSAGAVAALALLLRHPAATAPTPPPGNSGAIAQHVPAHAPPAQGSATQQLATYQPEPTEIESLDTPDGTGTVFNLEDEDGSTTVIWVTPEDTVGGI